MKISELIEQLAKALQEHGDIEVVKGIKGKSSPIYQLEVIQPATKRSPIRL